jgi:streptogramin lyase
MQERIWIAVLVSSSGLLACRTEETEPGGSAGSSGVEPVGGAGGFGAYPHCSSTGSGSVKVRIAGLPAAVAASLTLSEPSDLEHITAPTTLANLPAGAYQAEAARVADADPIVRTLYEYTLGETQFCLGGGQTHVIELKYAPLPSSHHLWTNNSNGTGNLLGFSGSVLAASAEAEPAVSVSAGAGKDVSFDADGNLWAMGSTVADSHLLRFPRAALASSGEKEADRQIDIAGVSCLPAMRALAFDLRGSLWVSTCGGRVVRLSLAEQARSGEVTPSVAIGNLTENGDLAFNSASDLWLTSSDGVVRFDAERLGASSDAPPELSVHVRTASDTQDVVPSNLAFDAAGNLWLIDFGGNLLSQVARADLEGSGSKSVVSRVTLALSVAALLERPAFDESGGLWLALNQNRFGRLTPAQLAASSTAGNPAIPATIITSPNMGNANRMAFFPAAAGLPLYHRFR